MLRHVKSLRPTSAAVLDVKELPLIFFGKGIAQLLMAAIKIENSSRVELPAAIHFGYFDISKKRFVLESPSKSCRLFT
jgi:hypothetical protein